MNLTHGGRRLVRSNFLFEQKKVKRGHRFVNYTFIFQKSFKYLKNCRETAADS